MHVKAKQTLTSSTSSAAKSWPTRRPCWRGIHTGYTSSKLTRWILGIQTFLMPFMRVCAFALNALDLWSSVRICTLVCAVKRALIISNAIHSVTSHYSTSPGQLFHPSCPHSHTFPLHCFSLYCFCECLHPSRRRVAHRQRPLFSRWLFGLCESECLCVFWLDGSVSCLVLFAMSRTLLECQSSFSRVHTSKVL